MLDLSLSKLIDSLNTELKAVLELSVNHCIARNGSEVLIEDLLYTYLDNNKNILSILCEASSCKKNDILNDLCIESYADENSTHPVISVDLIKLLKDAYIYCKLELNIDKVSFESLIQLLLNSDNKFKEFNVIKIIKENNLNISNISAVDRKINHEHDLEFTKDLIVDAPITNRNPILGRIEETQSIIDTLCRSKKGNPILVGHPGVGKTAIVEGLAIEIKNNRVPKQLQGNKLISLDLASMQAGASVKGEFEKRFKKLMEYLLSLNGSVILFIDEIHTLIGAGGQSGTNDAANLIKPLLARSGIKIIGATTWKEYKKYIEKDGALTRRFQNITVKPLDRDSTKSILLSMLDKLEKHHQVCIHPDAIESAVELSDEYIKDRMLPDKAIDLLDSVCARISVSHYEYPKSIKLLDAEIEVLRDRLEQEKKLSTINHDIAPDDIDKIEELLKVKTEEYQIEVERFDQETQKAKKFNDSYIEKRDGIDISGEIFTYISPIVDKNAVENVVSTWTGIPVESIKNSMTHMLDVAEKQVCNRVIGQELGINEIFEDLKINHSIFGRRSSPKGVYLILGPSGVGKTEFAHQLAESLYGVDEAPLLINLGEYKESHSVSKLIGSPPGYVGFGEGGYLTENIRRKPNSILLLDEFEKAHPDVIKLFYNIFDKGHIYDGEGLKVDFCNTIIICTSNMFDSHIDKIKCNEVNYKGIKSHVIHNITEILPAAIVSRVKIIPFMSLSKSNYEAILEKELKEIKEKLSIKNYQFAWDREVVDFISEKAALAIGGVRSLKDLSQNHVVSNLVKLILCKENSNRSIHVRLLNNSIELEAVA